MQFLARPANEERETVEEVQRPVRHDRPREKWDPALPAERDGRNVTALARCPVRKPVAREEPEAQDQHIADRRWPRTPFFNQSGRRDSDGRHYEATRRARETVKMPQSFVS